MAKIPTGNFGQSVVQPQRPVGAPDLSAPARAMGQLGQTAGAIANDQIAAQTRLDLERKDLEERTSAGRVRVATTNDLADLQDTVNKGVLDGTIPKGKAAEEWTVRATDLLADRTTGLAPQYASELSVQFEDLKRRGLNGVRDAVSRRDLQDSRANIDALGEEYGRMATRDRPAAIAGYAAVLEAEPDPERRQAKMQKFKEQTAYTNAFTLVRGSSRELGQVQAARKALGGDEFADIDPQRRAALDAQLDGYETSILQRQALAEQRAARQAEAHLNRARSAFEASQARVDAGIPDSEDQVTQTTQALAGTPYLQTYTALQQQARQNGGLAAQPIPSQRAHLDALYARRGRDGASEALNKQIDSAEKMLAASERDVTEDGLRAYVRRTPGQQLPQIDVSSVDGLTRSIGQRLALSQEAQAWARQPVSPLTSDEAQAVAGMLKVLPAPQRATALATISQQIGPQASAGLAKQIDQKDRALALALAYGAQQTSRGRPTSELILRGQQALTNKEIKTSDLNAAETGWRAQITKELGDAFLNEEQAKAVRDAAVLITAGKAAEEGRVDPRAALRLAVDGDVQEVNGRKTVVPFGMDDGDVQDRLRKVTAEDLKKQAPGGKVRVGKREVPLDAVVQAMPDAQLVYIRKGQYSVMQGGQVLTNDAGRRIVLEITNAR